MKSRDRSRQPVRLHHRLHHRIEVRNRMQDDGQECRAGAPAEPCQQQSQRKNLHGSNPLVYLVNGTIKSIEGYTKNLIDKVRHILKKRDLKASKTKISISWTLDVNEMRGDKIDVYTLLESKLRDYIGDVERRGNNTLDNYPSDKTTIYIACSKTDFQLLSKNNSAETIIVKANPFCEVV